MLYRVGAADTDFGLDRGFSAMLGLILDSLIG